MDFCRAARGEVAGKKSNRAQQESHSCESDGIGWSRLKKKRRNQTRDRKRSDDSNRNADERKSQGFPDNIQLDTRSRGAKGHAYADLLSLPRDRIGDNTINSQRRQQETQTGKGSHEQHKEAPGRGRVVH